jgi:hypothetical protein
MSYTLTMTSDEFGSEDFGPYANMKDALAAQARILKKVEELKDGIVRSFTIQPEDSQ